ncbi:hypothetical protein DCC81_23930 [Chitinophaga parva]|uniref:Uncharacterized protein n=1 Tax=Chitinophaga parva TaxID=2169414 RepID=A0A2T7BEC1_9BACT|nr:hypothetical protein [Chitinophaga parva]PUZ23431.1 hypothetical protein DCC81_23930 [Chitinophaga parva]
MNKEINYILPEGLIKAITDYLALKGIYTSTKRNKPTKDAENALNRHLYILNYIAFFRQYRYSVYIDEGVQINFERTKTVLGVNSDGMKAIFKNLIEGGFIELYSDYVFKSKSHHENKCNSYQFTSTWDNQKVIETEINNTSNLTQRIVSKIKKTTPDDVFSKYQEQMFLNNVDVDQTVYNYFEEKYGYTKDQLKNNRLPVESKDYSLYSIINKSVSISRPDKESRIYTPLTSLKKELRKYLLLDGKQLLGLDVKNCQLVISVLAVEALFEIKKMELTDDFNYYKQLAETGEIYEVLAKESGLLDLLKKDRTAFKQKLFSGYFFSNKKSNNKVIGAFEKLFPTVFNLINEFKDDYNYNKWAILLQQEESNILIEKVGKQLIEKEISYLSLHDGIYFSNEADRQFAKEIIFNQFKEAGINVIIKDENFQKTTALIDKKHENILWFEEAIGKQLQKHYFKIDDCFFNVEKLTRRLDGGKSKKIRKSEFLKLYTMKSNPNNDEFIKKFVERANKVTANKIPAPTVEARPIEEVVSKPVVSSPVEEIKKPELSEKLKANINWINNNTPLELDGSQIVFELEDCVFNIETLISTFKKTNYEVTCKHPNGLLPLYYQYYNSNIKQTI